MWRGFLFGAICFSLLIVSSSTKAQENPDMVVPAGTLLRCTMSEPNFSSATAEVGDPVLCHLSGVTEFGRAAFPRGTYLSGHLDAEKDPGHFFGKGYLKIVFDRIGFPNADASLDAKVIAARGYKVNKEGDIVGKGHAKRDAIEWMFPPLWPWKVLMLPARGPRPVLKGEQMLTLRLMEDVAIPRLTASVAPSRDWRPPVYAPQNYYPRNSSSNSRPSSYRPSAASITPAAPQPTTLSSVHLPTPLPTFEDSSTRVSTAGFVVENLPMADLRTRSSSAPPASSVATIAATTPSLLIDPAPAPQPPELSMSTPDASAPDVSVQPPPQTQSAPVQLPALNVRQTATSTESVTLVALKNETIYPVTKYWVSGDRLSYVLPSGASGEVALNELDLARTTQLNSERGINFVLKSGPNVN